MRIKTMTDKLRKITRLLAIPLLILWWFISLIQAGLLFYCCVLDFNVDECEFCIEDLFGLIKSWINNGADEL